MRLAPQLPVRDREIGFVGRPALRSTSSMRNYCDRDCVADSRGIRSWRSPGTIIAVSTWGSGSAHY
eukprot:9394895-Alexandrium_andersonii.AAC.1